MIPWAEIETRMRNMPSSREAEEFVRYEWKVSNQNAGFGAMIGASDQHRTNRKRVAKPRDHARWFKEAGNWLIGRVSAIVRV